MYNSIPLPKSWLPPKKIESPEKLWELAIGYFKNVDENPWIGGELMKSGDLAGITVTVKKRLPYTWSGFEVYCYKMGYNTRLDEYKSNRRGGYEAYADVIAFIDKTMYSQKFDGAVSGAFNHNIIARDLGLAERTIAEVKDTTDEIDYSELSDATLAEIAAARVKKPD